MFTFKYPHTLSSYVKGSIWCRQV